MPGGILAHSQLCGNIVYELKGKLRNSELLPSREHQSS